MNEKEIEKAVCEALTGDITESEAKLIAKIMNFGKVETVADIRENMRTLGDILTYTANRDQRWDGSGDEQ